MRRGWVSFCAVAWLCYKTAEVFYPAGPNFLGDWKTFEVEAYLKERTYVEALDRSYGCVSLNRG